MIRHIFVGSFREDVHDAQIDELLARWRRLQTTIPEIRSFTAGRNVSKSDRDNSFALVADFDDWAGWDKYMNDAEHEAIRSQLTSKLVDPERRAVVQLEI